MAVTSDKKIIGFIFGDEIRKRNSVRYGYIHWIAVDPMYRRRGVGTDARGANARPGRRSLAHRARPRPLCAAILQARRCTTASRR